METKGRNNKQSIDTKVITESSKKNPFVFSIVFIHSPNNLNQKVQIIQFKF